MQVSKHLLAISIASALVACGGSSDSNDPIETSSVSLSGKVIDGYVQGATVFLDLNLNRQLDEGEPSASSDDTGSYLIEVPEDLIAQAQYAPIRAYLGEGAIDLDTGEEFAAAPVLLSSPPISDLSIDTPPAPAVVTPFTTDLMNKVDETLELVVAGSVDLAQLQAELRVAKSELAEEYGVEDVDALLGDFLDGENVSAELMEELRDVAENRVNELQQDYERQKEAEEAAEEGQIVKTGSTRDSFVEWHTGELLHLLEEWTQVITENEDGSKITKVSGVKYFCNSDYTLKLNGSNDPLVYERYEVVQNLDGQGGFTASNKYNIDKNGDGEAAFFGQSYRVGTVSEDLKTWEFIEYFDESNPSDDDPSLDDLGRGYDDIDLVAAVAAGELDGMDMIQHKLEKTELNGSGELIKIYNFEEYTPDSFESLNSSTPYFAEMRTTTITSDSTIHVVEKDWGADGSINERSEQISYASGITVSKEAYPVWAWRGDDVWEEYADYRYDGGPLVNYWYEKETTKQVVEGIQTETYSGKRYVLDTETNSVGEDKALFQEYTSTYSYISDELTIEVASWTHYALDAYDFTVAEDDPGHKVTYWTLDSAEHKLWVGHEFAEWGSQNVTDLAEQLASLVASGVALADIGEEEIQGLSSYNRDIFTDSFLYGADGESRTWYVVWADSSAEYLEWELEEFNFVDDSELIFRAESGGLLALTRPGSESICFENGYCTDTLVLPLTEFDAEAGSFVTYFGPEINYFFQTQAEAEAKFEQLVAEVTGPETELFTIDFILDANATAADFEGWGIHLWNSEECTAYPDNAYEAPIGEWAAPIMPTSIGVVGMGLYGDVIGARFELPVYVDADCANFIIHKENEMAYETDMIADIGENQKATVTYRQAELVYSVE